MVTAIETTFVEPTKDMPIEVFRICHRLSYYMELMNRLPDGRVLWDDKLETIYAKETSDAEHLALQKGWIRLTMELPKEFIEKNLQ